VQSFRKTPFRKETEQQKQSLPKPENKMIDMKCEAATDKTKQNEAKPASRWKVDFIKKDDPEYRKKGIIKIFLRKKSLSIERAFF
jgi:hypothetical protein